VKGRTFLYVALWAVSVGLLAWGVRRDGLSTGRCHVQRPDGGWAECTPEEEERCEEMRQRFGIRTCVWPRN
jgi:hypothetical protein